MRPEVGKNWLVYFRDFSTQEQRAKYLSRLKFLIWSTFSQEATAVYSTALYPVLAETDFKSNTSFLGKNSQGLPFAFFKMDEIH